jgi:FtsP/CotA-like multicopper oxidase with cupredoxin domain
MSAKCSRRRLLASAASAGLAAGLPFPLAATAQHQLIADRRSIVVNGKPASVFGLRRPDGQSGLILDPGERFIVDVLNRTGEPTIVHWHGQTPPPDQDGVTDTGYVAPIAPGATQRYDFLARSGTHWMHSHHGLQEQALLAAPLIVRSADDTRLDAQEVSVLLHDFSFRSPAEVLAIVTGSAGMNHGAAPAMAHGRHGQQGAAAMDLNDFDYDAYLANDRTFADPLVVRTERSGRVRLRLINGATSTAFWIELGALRASLLAVDGNPVTPLEVRRIPLAQGQRVDLLLTMPAGGGAFPVIAQREGDRQRTGIILASPRSTITRVADLADAPVGPIDLSLETRLAAVAPMANRQPDSRHQLALTGSMMPYVWTLDGRSWANRQPLRIKASQRVEVDLVNKSQMAHPMHLHGHHFQVVAINGRRITGAVRDTVLVPVDATVTIAFDSDNPGRWLLHCHNLFHMATGMMTEVSYADVS